MKLHHALRHPQQAALIASAAATHTSRWLHLVLENDELRQREVWLDIDRWLSTQSLTLPGIPWQQVPRDYLAGWLNERGGAFLVEDEVWKMVAVSVPSLQPDTALNEVDAEPCGFISADWCTLSGETTSLSKALECKLQLVIGQSQLPLSALHDLETGDLLLIENTRKVVMLGNRKLFNFQHYSETEIMIDEPLEPLPVVSQEEPALLFDWNNLPLEVEFCLPAQTLMLNEIDELAPGVILTLPENAQQNISIYLNRKLLAQGELVALEEGQLGVEIQRIASQSREEQE